MFVHYTFYLSHNDFQINVNDFDDLGIFISTKFVLISDDCWCGVWAEIIIMTGSKSYHQRFAVRLDLFSDITTSILLLASGSFLEALASIGTLEET